jgi:HSP20 family protein
MLSRIMNVDPMLEMRSMEEMFNRLFAHPMPGTMNRDLQVATLPVDIYERENKLVIRAAVPGVKPEDLDVSVDNNVLTIRGESRSEVEQGGEGTKVYRREVSYGSFSRSIRLPENLQLDQADAEFNHGFVNITIPKLEEQRPQPRRLNVRSGSEGQTGEVRTESGASASPSDNASVQ